MLHAISHKNPLLSVLPANALSALDACVKTESLAPHTTIGFADSDVERVYFPQGGLATLVMQTASGKAIATGMVGREGVIVQ